MKSKHIPLRKCVACKQSFDKKDLIRIVKDKNGNVDVDEECKKDGRGAYICRNEKCLVNAEKKNVLSKFLNVQINHEIYDELRKKIIKK